MNKISISLIALPLLAAAALTACGGGGVTQQEQQAGSIVVGEPAPGAKLDTTDYIAKARSASCADLHNRLFVIDEKRVLWDRAGNCPDNANAQMLFGSTAQTALCQSTDTIAGPRVICNDDKDRDQFNTILKNLDKADLGLGKDHTVRAVDFLPANGTLVGMETLGLGVFSGIDKAQQVVIKDKASFAKLWADTYKNQSAAPTLPEVDFDSKMVIGVFAGNTPTGCVQTRITKVAVASDKLLVNISDHDNLMAMMCIQAVFSPFHMVAVKRSDAVVDFSNITGNKLYFQDVSRSSLSGINTPEKLVIRDAAKWASVWERHAGPSEPMPQIDFEKQMVIAVFLGQQNNGCYNTDIVNVDVTGGKINVTVRNAVPGHLTACTMMMTAPAHLVVTERHEGNVEFAVDEFQI